MRGERRKALHARVAQRQRLEARTGSAARREKMAVDVGPTPPCRAVPRPAGFWRAAGGPLTRVGPGRHRGGRGRGRLRTGGRADTDSPASTLRQRPPRPRGGWADARRGCARVWVSGGGHGESGKSRDGGWPHARGVEGCSELQIRGVL